MSWINDFAGRAEDFLNKLDSGAATVLTKDKKKKKKIVSDHEEVIVNELIPNTNYSLLTVNQTSPGHSSNNININVEKNLSISNAESKSLMYSEENKSVVFNEEKKLISINQDDKLIQYLNNSSVDVDALKVVSNSENISLNKSNDVNIKLEENPRDISINHKKENEMLRNEVRSLSSEITLLMNRAKSSEREWALAKSLLSKKEGDGVVLEKEVNSLRQKLLILENDNSELYNENINLKKCSSDNTVDKSSLENLEAKLSQCQLDAQHKEEALKNDIASLRIRVNELEQSLLKDRSDSAKELGDANARILEARNELEEYRIKAQWTLSEKEKLINELKKQDGNSESLVSLELQQSCEERSKLLDELEEVRKKLESSRKAESEAVNRLEAVREEAMNTLKSSQSRLAEETARRLAAEEHSASHAEELHSVREELWRQLGSLNSRLKERERELTRLRRQLSERLVTKPEPELTAALVKKQELIERLTIELSQTKLHLERVKASYNHDLPPRHTMYVNDTDDAKAQVPNFIMHTRFNRSVKKAYTCVEAFSRCLFLRRHPFARILLFCYLVLLHLWLCLVLFFSTPDSKLHM